MNNTHKIYLSIVGILLILITLSTYKWTSCEKSKSIGLHTTTELDSLRFVNNLLESEIEESLKLVSILRKSNSDLILKIEKNQENINHIIKTTDDKKNHITRLPLDSNIIILTKNLAHQSID